MILRLFNKSYRDGTSSRSFRFNHQNFSLSSKTFIITIFLGNLVFGFVPELVPLIFADLFERDASAIGLMRGFLTVGEIIGLTFIIKKFGKNVSFCFLLGTTGMAAVLSLALLPIKTIVIIYIIFFFYGFFDSITSPIFSYVISNIKSEIRGRVIAVINFAILFAAPLGIGLGTLLSEINIDLAILYCSAILAVSALVFYLNRATRKIVVKD